MKCAAILVVGLLLAGAADVPVLRGIASFLIVEDPLRRAVAIVALGGQTPFREIEAARLYHAGFASQVVIVREAPSFESRALAELGMKKQQSWEVARAVLIQQRVPASAILIPKDEAIGTLEELQAAWAELERQRSEVRGQKSEDTLRRDASGVRGEGKECAVSGFRCSVSASVANDPSPVTRIDAKGAATGTSATNATNASNATNAARNDDANNATKALPVILVTSKYHTRRTRLTWQYVTGGRSQPIVRAASGDPFDPESWWHTRSYALSVVREYLGLANYYAGFPVAP